MDPFLILSCNVLFYAYREASHALLILRLQPAGMRVFILFFNVPVSLCAVAWHQDSVIPDSKSAAFLTSFPWKMISYQGKKTCWNSVEMLWVTNSIEITGTEFSPFHGQPLSSRIRNHLAGKRCCLFFFFLGTLWSDTTSMCSHDWCRSASSWPVLTRRRAGPQTTPSADVMSGRCVSHVHHDWGFFLVFSTNQNMDPNPE